MALIRVLRGRASRLTQTATVNGTSDWMQTVHATHFLVGNRPTTFQGTCHLAEGDQVTVVGVELRGKFKAYAMRNDSTGVEYPAPRVRGAGISLFVLALLASGSGWFMAKAGFGAIAFPFVLIGMVCLFAAGIVFVFAKRNRQVNEALAAAREEKDFVGAIEEKRSLIGVIARGTIGVVGIVSFGFAVLVAIVVLADLVTVQELGQGGAITGLFMCLASGAFGYNLMRWGFSKPASRVRVAIEPPEAMPEQVVEVRQRLLSVAKGHGGRVTAAELAAELAIEQAPAQRVLDEATEAGDARLLFTPDGDPVYEFQGLVARKAEAKEPWDL